MPACVNLCVRTGSWPVAVEPSAVSTTENKYYDYYRVPVSASVKLDEKRRVVDTLVLLVGHINMDLCPTV